MSSRGRGQAGRKRYRGGGSQSAHRKMGPFDSVQLRQSKIRRFFGPARANVHYKPSPGYLVGQFGGGKPYKYSIYDRFGFQQTCETYGQNSMNDCNYIGVASVVPRHIAYSVGVSLARYIGYKHFKYEYQALTDTLIPGMNRISSTEAYSGISLYWRQEGISTAGTVNEGYSEGSIFTIAGATNVKTVDDFANWFVQEVNGAFNTTDNHPIYTLDHYRIWGEQFGTSTAEFADYTLRGVKVKLYSEAEMMIQNSTKADDGSTNIDVNNANPLRGNGYIFNGLAPLYNRVAASNWANLVRPDSWNWSTADGIHMVAGNPDTQYKIPPSPSVFSNCVKTYRVFLNPGEIKGNNEISTHGTFYISQLVKLLANRRTDLNQGRTLFNLGRLHLFALEQVVRTGAQAIVINYQQKRKWGTVIIPPKRLVMPRAVLNIEEANNPVA